MPRETTSVAPSNGPSGPRSDGGCCHGQQAMGRWRIWDPSWACPRALAPRVRRPPQRMRWGRDASARWGEGAPVPPPARSPARRLNRAGRTRTIRTKSRRAWSMPFANTDRNRSERYGCPQGYAQSIPARSGGFPRRALGGASRRREPFFMRTFEAAGGLGWRGSPGAAARSGLRLCGHKQGREGCSKSSRGFVGNRLAGQSRARRRPGWAPSIAWDSGRPPPPPRSGSRWRRPRALRTAGSGRRRRPPGPQPLRYLHTSRHERRSLNRRFFSRSRA